MTFEPDTGLVVNTHTGRVHTPDCRQAVGDNIAPWRGVAISPADQPCLVCLGGVLPQVAT